MCNCAPKIGILCMYIRTANSNKLKSQAVIRLWLPLLQRKLWGNIWKWYRQNQARHPQLRIMLTTNLAKFFSSSYTVCTKGGSRARKKGALYSWFWEQMRQLRSLQRSRSAKRLDLQQDFACYWNHINLSVPYFCSFYTYNYDYYNYSVKRKFWMSSKTSLFTWILVKRHIKSTKSHQSKQQPTLAIIYTA